jgi:hypothetical protein
MKWVLLGLFLVLARCSDELGPSAALDSGPRSDAAPTYYPLEKLKDPETCNDCHPKHYESWAGSMHAYASDDPIFLAMNDRGQKEAAIGNFCVKCHAPLAIGPDDATVDRAKLAALPKSQRGITCFFCHAIDAVNGTHDNPLHLAEDGVMRGQLADPVPNKAHASAYSPLQDAKNLRSASACGSCHDIVNGHGVHLERTFKEWQESVYSTENGNTCAQCHMYPEQNQLVAEGPDAPGVFLRTRHDHGFPAVDVALTPWPQIEQQRAAIQTILDDTTLQNALCVSGAQQGIPTISAIIDTVGVGHKWPSGAAQDRRAWFEITAYQGGNVIYQSGHVPPGTEPTQLADPDFWLLRDCSLDAEGKEVHMFWEVESSDPNLLPTLATFDQTKGAFYQTHQIQKFPRNSAAYLPAAPDRVTMSIWLQAFPLDVFDDLFQRPEEQGLTAEQVLEMRGKLTPFRVGRELVWTTEAMNSIAGLLRDHGEQSSVVRFRRDQDARSQAPHLFAVGAGGAGAPCDEP